ncbi:hypothetical protein B0H14DRAFT_3677971 [Mycena olivaceomarginata]|nr:hypothetical protein B0H14DRAFT_3677971 [Mycena olivaceomarginata]
MPLASGAPLPIAGGSDNNCGSLPVYSTVATALEASHIPRQLLIDSITQDRVTMQQTVDVAYRYGEYFANTDMVPELDSEDEAEPPALPYRRMARASLRALPFDDTEAEHDTVINSICAGEECRSTDLRPLPLDRWQSSLLRNPLPCSGDRCRRDLDDYDSHEEEAKRVKSYGCVFLYKQQAPSPHQDPMVPVGRYIGEHIRLELEVGY